MLSSFRMTGLWSSWLLLTLLFIFKSVHCITDSVQSLDEEELPAPGLVGGQSEIEGREYANDDDDVSLRNVLTMASKRFDEQTFFPMRGKKRGPGLGYRAGFHIARGRRSLADLSRMLYYDRDSPLLQHLYPELLRIASQSPSVGGGGGNKRLDSFSFFGMRGKRPSGWRNGQWRREAGAGERRNSYVSTRDLSGSFQDGISLKRQPPPGFYGLRG